MDYLIAFAAVITPLLLIVLAVMVWKLRESIDARIAQATKLAEDQFSTYNAILEPFSLLLMTQAAWEREGHGQDKSKSDAAISKLLSGDYRDAAFRLSQIANDKVVLAYNELIQYFCSQDSQQASPDVKLKTVLSLLGNLLLEIRKSLGHESTRLDNWQMLESYMTDVRKLKNA